MIVASLCFLILLGMLNGMLSVYIQQNKVTLKVVAALLTLGSGYMLTVTYILDTFGKICK